MGSQSACLLGEKKLFYFALHLIRMTMERA